MVLMVKSGTKRRMKMKRFLSILICVLMLTSLTAYADDYDLLAVQYTGYEADVGFTLKFGGADLIADALPTEFKNVVDVKALVGELSNSTFVGRVKLNSNADYTKAKISYELNSAVPLRLNRNFKVTSELAFGMWLDWDITDELNPQFNVIYSMPFCNKYISANITDMARDNGVNESDVVSNFKSLMSKENIKEQNAKFIDILRQNSNIKASASVVKITADCAQMEEITAKTAELVRDLVLDNKDFDMLTDGDNGALADFFPTEKAVRKFFEKNRIFADNALTIELAKSKNGMLTAQNMNVNLSLDASGLFGAQTDGRIDVSLGAETKYKNINGNVNVEFPVLNGNNSIALDEIIDGGFAPADYGWDTDNCWHYEYGDISCDFVPADVGFYVSLNGVTSAYRRYGHDYSITKDGNTVTVTDKSGNERFSKAVFTLDSSEYSVDGKVFNSELAPVESDGETYISRDAVRGVFGVTVDNANRSLEDGTITIFSERQSPMCHHTQEQIDAVFTDDYDEEYCEHYQADRFYCNVPYNGTGYVSIRELAVLMADGGVPSLTYDNGVVTLSDLSGAESFKTLVFTVGSNVIYKDGEAYSAAAPVTEYEDVVYIDVKSAKDLLGFDTYSPSVYYTFGDYGIVGTSYSATLARKNPRCRHSDDETQYYKWWE